MAFQTKNIVVVKSFLFIFRIKQDFRIVVRKSKSLKLFGVVSRKVWLGQEDIDFSFEGLQMRNFELEWDEILHKYNKNVIGRLFITGSNSFHLAPILTNK